MSNEFRGQLHQPQLLIKPPVTPRVSLQFVVVLSPLKRIKFRWFPAPNQVALFAVGIAGTAHPELSGPERTLIASISYKPIAQSIQRCDGAIGRLGGRGSVQNWPQQKSCKSCLHVECIKFNSYYFDF